MYMSFVLLNLYCVQISIKPGRSFIDLRCEQTLCILRELALMEFEKHLILVQLAEYLDLAEWVTHAVAERLSDTADPRLCCIYDLNAFCQRDLEAAFDASLPVSRACRLRRGAVQSGYGSVFPFF